MPKLHRMNAHMVAFHCPGCKHAHGIFISGTEQYVWQWNGSMDAPTFVPSIVTWYEDDKGTRRGRCHSFVREGKIQFLADCLHELRNQTVELPEWD